MASNSSATNTFGGKLIVCPPFPPMRSKIGVKVELHGIYKSNLIPDWFTL